MRGALVALACLMLVAVSGCLTEKDDPSTDSVDGTSSSSSPSKTTTVSSTSTKSTSSTATKAPANGTNHAPTINITASPANGTAPLNVTFGLTGSDADGDKLHWVLMLPNETIANGIGLPANHTHSFAQAGNYTVTVSVWDGTVNVTAETTVVVTAGSNGPSPPAEPVVELCPTDEDAIAIPGAGLYMTPMDTVNPATLGDFWVYEESNGMAGLQRNDGTVPTSCPTPDTIIF